MGGPEITPAAGAALATLAATAVAARLAKHRFEPEPPEFPELLAPGASFVTLERGGALRGCVGSLDAARPLYLDVARNAVRAMADPRLPALAAHEWDDLHLTVSALGGFEPVPAGSLDELAGSLRPGVDGVIITDGYGRATFLPVVWGKLPDPTRFIEALLAKGGWPAGRWPPRLSARRYQAAEFHNRPPREPLASAFGPPPA